MESCSPPFKDTNTPFSVPTVDWQFDPFAPSTFFSQQETPPKPTSETFTIDRPPTDVILKLMENDTNLAPLVPLYKSKLAPARPLSQTPPITTLPTTATIKSSIFGAPAVVKSEPNPDDWDLPDPEDDYALNGFLARLKSEQDSPPLTSSSSSGPFLASHPFNLFEEDDVPSQESVLLQSAAEEIAPGLAPHKSARRSSRMVPIGKDYLDHENREVLCGQANGLAVMTQPNTGFETSLSQFLPLLSDVTELLLSDLGTVSPSTTQRLASPIPRWGAVCRSERSRVHYFLHCYDPLLPVLRVFERLMLDPRLARLDSIARVYPVTIAAHPDLDFAQVALGLLSAHPRLKTTSKPSTPSLRASSSPSASPSTGEPRRTISDGVKWPPSDLFSSASTPPQRPLIQPPPLSQSTSSLQAQQSQKVTIGLAIESHRASDFAKELSAFLLKTLPFLEIVERNPMSCDLMLSMCYFNSVFLIALWDPINANCLNNYRPSEMATWASLHPRYTPRVASTTQKYIVAPHASKKMSSSLAASSSGATTTSTSKAPIGSGRLALLNVDNELIQSASGAHQKPRSSSFNGTGSKYSSKKHKRTH